MAVLSTASVRVVDPILTSVVQGYRQADLVGGKLFPSVPVAVSGGKILKFGKESFQLYNARRAPGGATKRVQFGYEAGTFALEQDSLEGKVPREWQRDAAAVPGIDLGTRAVNGVMRIITLSLEVQQAGLATNPANYDANHKRALTAGTKWSADTGKPVSDIKDAREAVRAGIGVRPNVLVLSPLAWAAASENNQVLERREYVEKGPVTLAEFGAMVEVDTIVVGEAVYHDGEKFQDVWGNAAVLAYAPPTPAGQEEPSYAYTYTMEGNPLAETAYYDNNAKSWIYPVTYERAPVLTGEVAGFLFTGCK
jgi:hypothetical protein